MSDDDARLPDLTRAMLYDITLASFWNPSQFVPKGMAFRRAILMAHHSDSTSSRSIHLACSQRESFFVRQGVMGSMPDKNPAVERRVFIRQRCPRPGPRQVYASETMVYRPFGHKAGSASGPDAYPATDRGARKNSRQVAFHELFSWDAVCRLLLLEGDRAKGGQRHKANGSVR